MPLMDTICQAVMLGFLLLQTLAPLPAFAAPEVLKVDISEPKSHESEPPPHDLFMWKVKGKAATAYLVGSIHVLPPDFFPLPADIEKAFNNSQTLIVEANIDDHPNETQRMMMSRATYPEGDKLPNHVSKKTLDQLNEYLHNAGMSVERFFLMKPWFIGATITLLQLQKLGFDSESGIDKHFLAEARTAEKPIVPLETAEFELNILSGFNDEEQEQFLQSALLDAENEQDDARTMIHAWKTGDGQEMLSIITRDEREHPELKHIMDKILYDRNVTMTAKLTELMEKPGTYFVVLGAGHVVGPDGIVSRLRKQRYQVEQVVGR
jgi:uncharacterized protein YbaP (TraB family)